MRFTVTYRYRKAIDPTQSRAFGLIAEEVAEVSAGLVACNGARTRTHFQKRSLKRNRQCGGFRTKCSGSAERPRTAFS
jgi:hypothetical protein